MIIKNHYCIIDTETGGLDPQKNPICEIAFVILNKDLQEVDRYQQIVQNYNDLTYTSIAMGIHGIRRDEIDNGMPIKDCLKEVDAMWQKYTDGRNKVVLVGHNMSFDYGMLKYAFDYCGMDIHRKSDPILIDTMWMSRLAWGHDDSMINFKLDTCCERVGVHMSDAHRALGDVLSTAELFRALVNHMRRRPSSGVAAESVNSLRKHQFKF